MVLTFIQFLKNLIPAIPKLYLILFYKVSSQNTEYQTKQTNSNDPGA